MRTQPRHLRNGYWYMRRQQAAAVCYRQIGDSVEFLLVLTNSGKWTFPKGCIDVRGTGRETALREALEEAGAVGDIAQEPFCRYIHGKGVFWKRGGLEKVLVRAYLMEVLFTVLPSEKLRNPTWFSATNAKLQLCRGREEKYQRELEAVIDEALLTINRQAKAAGNWRAS